MPHPCRIRSPDPYRRGMTVPDELLNRVTWKVPNALALVGSRAGEVVAAAVNDDEARPASMADTRMKYGGVPRKAHGGS